MKTNLFLLCLLFLVSGISYSQCPLTTPEFPFETEDEWWGDTYSWSSGLYLPSQVGGANTITTLGFRNNAGSGNYSNVRIYMRHTSTANFASETGYPGTAGFTLVWTGTMNFSGGGVYNFPLLTPFVFNGTDNLEVLFEHSGGENYDPWEPWFHRTNAAPPGVFPGKVGAGSSWVNATSVTSNRVFNLAIFVNGISASCDYNLPVELNYASIECDKNNVNLEWATFSETNNNYYEIEFSEDGKIWRNIGRVEGAGNSTEDLAYSFNLNNYQRDNVTYVRLSQVDYDGTRELLNTLSVNCNAFEREIRAYPVPFNDQVTIEAKETPASIAITDVSGRKMNVSYTTEGNKIKINTSSLENGNYIIMLQFTSSFETLKVTKM